MTLTRTLLPDEFNAIEQKIELGRKMGYSAPGSIDEVFGSWALLCLSVGLCMDSSPNFATSCQFRGSWILGRGPGHGPCFTHVILRLSSSRIVTGLLVRAQPHLYPAP